MKYVCDRLTKELTSKYSEFIIIYSTFNPITNITTNDHFCNHFKINTDVRTVRQCIFNIFCC